jgi:alpha-aminoadipate carrier protein LysW
MEDMMTNCPSCDAEIVFDDDAEEGEIIECPECGVELEIVSLDPAEVQEAPEEEEDWGE